MITVLVTLIQNAALLLATMVVFDLVTSRKSVHGQWRRQAVAGLILGGLCIGLMLASFTLETGIIFDTRSVLLSLSGLFLGPLPTLVAMVISSVYRLLLGGVAALPGTGVILATGAVGILWRRYRTGRLEEISARELYLFGVVVHIIMLTILMTLPWEAAKRVIAGIGLPVMVVYPMATIALGWLLSNRLQRENANLALRESEKKYRLLFESNPMPMWVYDMETLAFLSVNDAAVVKYGYSREEFLRMSIKDIRPAEDVMKLLANVQLSTSGFNESGVWRHCKKDGSIIFVEISSYVIEFEGRKAELILSNDITERKHLQEELEKLNTGLELKVQQRTALLEAANRELEAFSYSVSHDLRAPLRHINGYVDMLNRKYYDNLDERARHYLDTISGASRKMGTLIDDLLQFSRTGRQELSRTEFDLNMLVQEVLKELEPLLKSRNIIWEIQDLPMVFGDYSLLKLVWSNLIDNAIKYTRNQSTAKISVSYRTETENFVFCISDNGVGFDMKYAHKLFGVFQRLHTQEEFEGTGIGLASVQRIIHKHAGRVWAEAEKDKGASFYFSLPKMRE